MNNHHPDKNTYTRLRSKIKFKKVKTDTRIMQEEFSCIFSDISKQIPEDSDEIVKHFESGIFGEIYGEAEHEASKPKGHKPITKWKDVFKLNENGDVVVLKPYKHIVTKD